MTDKIIYKVVSLPGGGKGRGAPIYEGGKVLFVSFDRYEAEKKVDAWSTLKIEVIENIESEIALRMAKLDPVDFLLLEKGFLQKVARAHPGSKK
jgi:hypothetical protein